MPQTTRIKPSLSVCTYRPPAIKPCIGWPAPQVLAELENLAKMSHLIGCPKERTARTQPIPWLLRLEAIELLFTLLTAWLCLCDSGQTCSSQDFLLGSAHQILQQWTNLVTAQIIRLPQIANSLGYRVVRQPFDCSQLHNRLFFLWQVLGKVGAILAGAASVGRLAQLKIGNNF